MTIELVTTDGIFALDGGEWDVTNNIWLVGDDREVVVIDAAHDHRPIVDAVNGRRVRAIVLTHGHNDHINAAVPLRDAVDAPIWLHDADRMLWDVVWPGAEPDHRTAPGESIAVGGHELGVLHTPGHSPGCCCFHDAGAGAVFSGDTLFCGGPGATGRSYSDEPTILRSIRDVLLALPDETDRPHRPRRVDDDRRRAPAGPRAGRRTGPLTRHREHGADGRRQGRKPAKWPICTCAAACSPMRFERGDVVVTGGIELGDPIGPDVATDRLQRAPADVGVGRRPRCGRARRGSGRPSRCPPARRSSR